MNFDSQYEVYCYSISDHFILCFTALPLSHKETTDDARDSRDTAGDNRDLPGRSNKLGDMEIVDGQLSSIDFDENSASDKTRRTQFAKRSDKMDDSPAADL